MRPEGSMSASRGSDVFRTSGGSVPKGVALLGNELTGDSTFGRNEAAGAVNAAADGISGLENDAAGVVIWGGAIGGTDAAGVVICGGAIGGTGAGDVVVGTACDWGAGSAPDACGAGAPGIGGGGAVSYAD